MGDVKQIKLEILNNQNPEYFPTEKLVTIICRGEEEGKLVYRRGSGTTIEIYEIEVRSDRRKGVGRALIEKLIEQAKRLFITRIWALTREENKIAQTFYNALGFTRSDLLRNFYPDGSAYLFWKEI